MHQKQSVHYMLVYFVQLCFFMNIIYKCWESGDKLPHTHVEEADFKDRKGPLDILEYL